MLVFTLQSTAQMWILLWPKVSPPPLWLTLKEQTPLQHMLLLSQPLQLLFLVLDVLQRRETSTGWKTLRDLKLTTAVLKDVKLKLTLLL
jgi:hypothetical protein